MRERITVEQVKELTSEQQEGLREWWDPQLYDIALSCDNRPFEVYGSIVIGETDSEQTDYPTYSDLKTYHRVSGAMEEEDVAYYGKCELFPLLSIGQMISILHAHDKDFCLDRYHYVLHENGELCDALWEDVKRTLVRTLHPPELKPPRVGPAITMQQATEVLKDHWLKSIKEAMDEDPNESYKQIFKHKR